MKKGAVLILAVLYITLTSGIVVNVHYCMGRLTDVTYGHDAGEKCGRCGMEQKNGCCDTESKLIKADTDHLYAKSVTVPSFTSDVAVYEYSEYSTLITTRDHHYCQYHSPPEQRGNNLATYISVFRI